MKVAEKYKQTEVGIIPCDWEVHRLKKVVTLINGRAYKQEELLLSGKYQVLRVGNFFSNNSWYYSDLELEENKYVYNGDLMYAWSASFGPRFWNEEKTIYHYHIWKVIPSDRIDKLFLFHLFEFDKAKILNQSQGGTMFHITKGDMETRFLQLPTKAEQTAIATALSDADALISSLEKLIAKKRNIKQGAMQNLLQPKEGWEVKKLGEICDVRDGTHDSPKYFDNGVMFVTSKNIIDGKLDFTDISFISKEDSIQVNQRSKVDNGDILMSMIGTIGNAVLVDFEPDFCIKNVALLKPKKINPIYLLQLIYSPSFQKYIESRLDGGIQKFISLSVLRDLDIPSPSFDEQICIATILSDMDAEITALETKLEKYRRVKLGMMQNLLTGKIRLI